jgi:hypothetical protein
MSEGRWRWWAAVVVGVLAGGCGPASREELDAARDAEARRQSADNLRVLALSLRDYARDLRSLPPARGEKFLGLGGYSWRVHLLPYLGWEPLYKSAWRKRAENAGGAERWDDPELLAVHIGRYNPNANGETYYRVFVGPGTAFEDRGEQGFENKLLVVEAGSPAPWPMPEALEYSPDRPLPPLGGLFPDGFHGVYGDGEVRFFPRDMDEALIRAAVAGTYQGERPGRKLAK